MKKLFKTLFYFFILLILALVIIGKTQTKSFELGSLSLTQDWKGKFIDIHGEKIRYLQQGKGQDILLIHGTPGSIEDWQPIIDSLSTAHRVTVFDRPGHGFSTATDYHYTIAENAELANQLIDTLELDSVIVVGHSYGGSVAAHMATTKNNKIQSYIIVASPLYQFTPEKLYKMSTLPLIGKGITFVISNTLASQKIEEGLTNAFGGNTDILTGSFLKTRKQLWSQPKVLYATSKERIHYDKNLKAVSENYKDIHKKVSILYGTKDHASIQQDCAKLHEDIPNSELIVLKNTAHYIQFERTTDLLTVIKSHLKSNINVTDETANKEKIFFKKDEIKLPEDKEIYTSSKNEIILFRPTEFEFGKMVEDSQSDSLVALDSHFEKLANSIAKTFKDSKNTTVTIVEKPFVAIKNTHDTLYLDTSKSLYGIVIHQLQSPPVFVEANQPIEKLIHTINTTFNLKK